MNIQPHYQKDFQEFEKKLQTFLNSEDQYLLPQKNGTKKDVLLLGATHGDEKIGPTVLSKIKATPAFDWILSNEKAAAMNKRFLETDMNRCAPGNINSVVYEERRAAELIRIFKNYNYVVDIHGTVSNSGLFIILTKFSFDDFLLALQFDIPNIVLWLPSEPKSTGPLAQFSQPGIEIECGPKDSPAVAAALQPVLEKFLADYQQPITKDKFKNKNLFWVQGKLEKSDQPLVDFQKTKLGDDEFYPLLAGEYGLGCYKMYRII